MAPRKLDLNQNSGVEVLIESLKDHPSCPHGPTLLFLRKLQEKGRKFFACSACRDRKHCQFFLWEDERHKITKSKVHVWEKERLKFLRNIDHRKKFILLNKVRSLPVSQRIYCRSCSTLVLENHDEHVEHNLRTNLTDYELEHPSEILDPLENPKTEAQYLFSKSTVKVLVDIFQDLGYQNVICIGTPRIHEYIQLKSPNISSILLDIDNRYHNFFGPLQFGWYNSFNNYFFFKEAQLVFEEFLRNTGGIKTVLVTDPPFGGRIEPLAQTFITIGEKFMKVNNAKNNLPIFWIFPYFMEPQIQNALPDFTMLDYKVDYDNHPLFQSKGRKRGSPVRIFTNVRPSLIKLPEDSYKFCNICDKYVSKENKHCELCQSCTSKNGETYIHCRSCKRCVKPTWIHCRKCNRCALRDHKCTKIIFTGICLNCKETGHKRIDCPQVRENCKSLKRKTSAKIVKNKIVRK